MAQKKWDGIRNKSFTLPDLSGGGELVISETSDRRTIAVSIRCDSGGAELAHCKVDLTKAQFDALCDMNSSYDGLEVREDPKPAGWDDAPEGAVLPSPIGASHE
jgi:hypothetical protein